MITTPVSSSGPHHISGCLMRMSCSWMAMGRRSLSTPITSRLVVPAVLLLGPCFLLPRLRVLSLLYVSQFHGGPIVPPAPPIEPPDGPLPFDPDSHKDLCTHLTGAHCRSRSVSRLSAPWTWSHSSRLTRAIQTGADRLVDWLSAVISPFETGGAVPLLPQRDLLRALIAILELPGKCLIRYDTRFLAILHCRLCRFRRGIHCDHWRWCPPCHTWSSQ